MYIYIEGQLTSSDAVPNDFIATDRLEILLSEMKLGEETGRYALECQDLGEVREALENGALLSFLKLDENFKVQIDELYTYVVEQETRVQQELELLQHLILA